jgi:hypothetical protein
VTKPKSPVASLKIDYAKLSTELQQRLLEVQRRNEHQQETIKIINRELRDAVQARDATQELLDACLSSDVDAKHSVFANVVRNTLCAMLKRQGWLDHSEAREWRRTSIETQNALTAARRHIEAANALGVKPADVAVSPDGSWVAYAVGPIKVELAGGPAEHKTASGKKSKPSKK